MTFFELERDFPELFRKFEESLDEERRWLDGKVFDLLTNRVVLLCDKCSSGGEEMTIGLGGPQPCWACGAVVDPDKDGYHFVRGREVRVSDIGRLNREPDAGHRRPVFGPLFNSGNRADWVPSK